MTSAISKAWEEVVRPMLLRPKRVQVAALCFRETDTGKDVLLITSRGSGRWIVPKGWPIDGMGGSEAALREAWEEAGVREAKIQPVPIGTYGYSKVLDNGASAPIETQVYLARVCDMSDTYPEAPERQRRWVSAEDAANMVDEPGLQDILRAI